MAEFTKLARIPGHNGLRKKDDGGASGAPATVAAINVGGVPLEKIRAVVEACPAHLRGRGQHALDKAQRADATGNDRLVKEADRELACIVTEAAALSNEQQCAKLITASRRTVDRDQIGAWFAHLEGRP